MGLKRDTISLGDIMPKVLETLRPGEIADRVRVEDAWRAISDLMMLRHTRVQAFKDGVVTVAVHSPPLCSALAGFRVRPLTEKLRETLGGVPHVRQLRFVHSEN